MAVDGDREIPAITAAVSRLVETMRQLAGEVTTLRLQNDRLEAELERLRATSRGRAKGAALASPGARSVPRTRGKSVGVTAAGRVSRNRAVASRGGRSTPPEVTDAVVRAALNKLGEATAGEIAAEITRAGSRVSGRAIRFLAEGVGATVVASGADGQRRYRLG
ncbi:MAG: hypothetical protein ABR541_07060 [Candidatus Dormibacteria bacterium]